MLPDRPILQKTTVKIKRQAWLENVRMKLAIGGVVLVVVVIIIVILST